MKRCIPWNIGKRSAIVAREDPDRAAGVTNGLAKHHVANLFAQRLMTRFENDILASQPPSQCDIVAWQSFP